jgi:hypothetical protein
MGTNLPFETADIRFSLRSDGDHTIVTISPKYKLKYGPLGSFMDRIYVRGTYRKGVGNLLQGLKEHVENRHTE